MILWMWLACAAQKTQVETFETTWSVVNETFPYEDFNGADWNGIHETYLPKVKKTRTPEELRPILTDMLAELQVSHMAIIPQEEFSAIEKSTDDKNDSKERSSQATQIKDVNDTPSSSDDGGAPQGWVGLSARWIEDQLVITSVSDRDDVQMGWVIESIAGTTVESVQAKFTDPRKKSFYMGYFAERHFYGDIEDTVDIVFKDHELQIQERTLEYEKGQVMTTGTSFNLPSTGVSFVYEEVEPSIVRMAFSSFMLPIRDPMTKAFEDMATSNPQGLIVDLRGNPGGLIVLGQLLSSYLISEKGLDLGEQISRDGNLFLTIHPRPKSQRYSGPVAFLVDETSASTSEVLAGGLQELGRVQVFGQQTAGKALPSGIRELPNGDRFQFVLFDLKTPSGGRYEGTGVIPDVPIVRTKAAYVQGIDPELVAAVQWIKEESNQTESGEIE